MSRTQQYPIGSLVRSINGERDNDENDQARFTGPDAWGWIEDYFPKSNYSVCFSNGTSVFITEDELDNRKEYDVCTPQAMAGRLKEIREKQTEWSDMEEVPDIFAYLEVLTIVGA